MDVLQCSGQLGAYTQPCYSELVRHRGASQLHSSMQCTYTTLAMLVIICMDSQKLAGHGACQHLAGPCQCICYDLEKACQCICDNDLAGPYRCIHDDLAGPCQCICDDLAGSCQCICDNDLAQPCQCICDNDLQLDWTVHNQMAYIDDLDSLRVIQVQCTVLDDGLA